MPHPVGGVKVYSRRSQGSLKLTSYLTLFISVLMMETLLSVSRFSLLCAVINHGSRRLPKGSEGPHVPGICSIRVLREDG